MSLSTKQTELLKQLYYDPETGFGSAGQLFKRARALDDTLTLKMVTGYVSSLPTAQITKRTRYQRGEGGHFQTFAPGGLLQGDLIDMQKLSKFNGGNSWILIVVDIYSRRIFAEASRTKKGPDITEAYAPIAKQYNDKDYNMILLVTDSGNEFLNSNFQAALSRNGTQHNTVEVGDHKAMGVVDRAIRSFREKLQRHFTANGTKNWTNVLDALVKNMNSTINQGVGATPNDIWSGKVAPSPNWEEIFSDKSKDRESTKRYRRFKVGDTVRVVKNTAVFTKKSQAKGFTKSLYSIRGQSGKKFLLTRLKDGVDMDDKYRAEELLLANDVAEEDDLPELPEEQGKAAQRSDVKLQKSKRTFARTGLDAADRAAEPLAKRVRKAPERFGQ
jgi:hypothetical protein